MFPLHDRTRRRIVLTAFGMLCAVPTLLVLLWGLSRSMPWYSAAEVRRLEGVLGLRVHVDRARNTRPGVWRYEGFALHDPETGRRLIHCEQLEANYTGHGSSAPATLVLRAHKTVASEPAAKALYQILARAMQGQIHPAPLALQWTAEDLAFGEEGRVIRLAGFSGGMDSHPGAILAQLRFRLADGSAAEPAHIEIQRNRNVSPASLEWKLYTGAAPLPCRLLAAGLPAFESLGPNSHFRGYMRAGRARDGWQGELTGHFSDVDLGSLVRERFAQHFTGTGQVSVERARFDTGRIEEAWGSVAIGPGTIGYRLLDAAVEQLSLIQSALPSDCGPSLPYQHLVAHWRVSADGLRLEGRCPAARPGTLLTGADSWHVAEPVVQPLPVAALVRALVPDESPDVPATPQTGWLLRHLPLPEPAHDPASRRVTERLR